MNAALWLVQILLAIMFGVAGMMKAKQSKEALQRRTAWAEDFTLDQIRVIAALEIAAAFGLIIPWLTGVVPVLTPLAAVGLGLTMVGAAMTHLKRSEIGFAILNVVLLVLAAFVAYGRFVEVAQV